MIPGGWEWLVILLIVVLIFGAKKLKNLGGDLGGAIKNFKKAVKEEDKGGDADNKDSADGRVIEGESTKEKDKV